MKNVARFYLFIFAVILTGFQNANAQSRNVDVEYDVEVTYAEFLGKTPPVRDLVPMDPTNPDRRAFGKLAKKAPLNFTNRRRHIENPNALPQGEDPIRQTSAGSRSPINDVIPLVNINGITSNAGPYDPTGDIGKDHYLQAVNATQIRAYDKEGVPVGPAFAANTIWSAIGQSSAGDPIILYDQLAERWIITEFPNGNFLLIAVSEDSDPLGSYNTYAFATPNFPDYPKYGIWQNSYTVTTNEQGGAILPSYHIDRDALLNGDAMVTVQRITLTGIGSGPGFQVATPVDFSGLNSPVDDNPIILTLSDDGWGAAFNDEIRIHTLDIDFEDSNNTTVTTTAVPLSPFDTNPCSGGGGIFDCVPQQGGGNVDGLREVIMNQVHYRNFGTHEAMVLNFITDVTGGMNLAGIRWVEMRRMPGGEWELYQEGTYSPDDGLDRYMGSICMDASGNIGLAYSASSENDFIGLRFTGRFASDPLGEMTVNEYVLAVGGSTLNTGGRYADYAHMSIDPEDDRTFWFTSQYAGANGSRSRIAAFQMQKDTTNIGPITLLTPQSSPDLTAMEAVQIEIKNFGLDTPSVFQVGFAFDGAPPISETVTFDLYPDSIYTHTFPQTVDMSVIGDYNFEVFTFLDGDSNTNNDLLRVVRSKLPKNDAGISGLDMETNFCGDSTEVEILLTNFGTDNLTSATINLMLDGTLIEQLPWTGTLAIGDTESITYILTGFGDGMHELEATSISPNGVPDERDTNDSSMTEFMATLEGTGLTFTLNLDNFPMETTWQVEDAANNIVFSGGPYENSFETIVETWCVDPDDCFTFTLFDSFGDGITSGSYVITDEAGLPVASLINSSFGTIETNEFCGTFTCTIAAEFDIDQASSEMENDGRVVITITGGVGPFEYSNDGGASWQLSRVFLNQLPGTYSYMIRGAGGCVFEQEITIDFCAIQAAITVLEPDQGASNGSITIDPSNFEAPVAFSINGGTNFSATNVFQGLGPGTYNVVVLDGTECEYRETIVFDDTTPTKEYIIGQQIEVFPNPTTGVFRININGFESPKTFLRLQVLDVSGKLVYERSLAKYDNTYTGLLSLYAFPDGLYFVRFPGDEINTLIPIVKQE